MPEGDGQGAKLGHRGAGRADELTPKMLKLRTIELHQEALSGKVETGHPLQYHEMRIEQLLAEVAELDARSGGWTLEAMAGHARLCQALDEADGEPERLPLCELNLCERTINALESRGTMTVGDLVQWTAAMVLAMPDFAKRTLAEVDRALAEVGLALREPAPDEVPEPPPFVEQDGALAVMSENDRKKQQAQLRKQNRKLILALAAGKSQREANREAGMAPGSQWAVRNLLRNFRRSSTDPIEAAKELGFVRGTAEFRAAIAYLGPALADD